MAKNLQTSHHQCLTAKDNLGSRAPNERKICSAAMEFDPVIAIALLIAYLFFRFSLKPDKFPPGLYNRYFY